MLPTEHDSKKPRNLRWRMTLRLTLAALVMVVLCVLLFRLGGNTREGSVTGMSPLALVTEHSSSDAAPPGESTEGESADARVSAASESPQSSEPQTAGPHSVPTAIELPGGLTEEHLERLLILQRQFKDAEPSQKANWALHYAGRSVATILQARGLADFGTPEEKERHGLSSRPNHELEWVFLCDGARFRFNQGQYSAYDMAREFLATVLEQRTESNGKADPPDFPQELDVALDRLADEAIQCFEKQK